MPKNKSYTVTITTTHECLAFDEEDARDQAIAELESQLRCGDIPDDITFDVE